MQVISAHHAISLYPLATFGQRRSLIMKTGRDIAAPLQKYAERGWLMVGEPDYRSAGGLEYRWSQNGCFRRIGDRFCWTIPLAPLSTHRSDGIFANSWSLRRFPGSFVMEYCPLDAFIEDLQFQYIIAPECLGSTSHLIKTSYERLTRAFVEFKAVDKTPGR